MCTTCLWPPPLGVDLLVRTTWDRRVDHPERYLWASMAAQPVAGTLTLEVSRRGAQPARLPLGGPFWSAKPASAAPPPDRTLAQVEVFAVQVLEEHPLAGIEPIEWLLLTPWAVATFADPGYTLGGAQALLFEHIGRPTVFASAAVS
jgi:hypothetical protein